jgi:putative membrane protein
LLAFLGTVPALADMGWGWSHHSWWGGGLMMFGWLLLIAVVVIVLVRAFDRRDQARDPAPQASDAEQVLAGRYALGEIDETEYRARLAVLKEHR